MKRMIKHRPVKTRSAVSGRPTLVALLCIAVAMALLTDSRPTMARSETGTTGTAAVPLEQPRMVDTILEDDTGPSLNEPADPADLAQRDDAPGPVDMNPLDPPEDPAEASEKDQRIAYLIHIKQPITAATAKRVTKFCEKAMERARAADRTPVLIFQFDVPEGQEPTARGSQYGLCYDLANYISGPATGDAKTVAYVPRAVLGHAILVAAACETLFTTGDTRIGPVGVKKDAITLAFREAYKEIPARTKTFPVAVSLWLLDPTTPVSVITTEKGEQIVLDEELPALRETRNVTIIGTLEEMSGAEPGVITGDAARRLDIVSRKLVGEADLATALDLKDTNIISDPALSGDVRPILVSIKGPIQAEKTTQLIMAMQKKVREDNANLVIVWIDSPGGLPEASTRLAGEIASLGPDVRTVAYVPREAFADAALVALACDDLIVTSDTRLGGSGVLAFDSDEIELLHRAISSPDGAWKHRSWSLIAAMIDPDLTVYRCSRGADTAFFSNQEFEQYEAAHPGEQPWQRGLPVTLDGREFRCDGDQATEYGLAREIVGGFAELKQLYDVEGDPGLAEPAWHDTLIRALASPSLAGLLLTIGLVTLYAELHMPGIGVGGFIAAICFLLFFWSSYLGGTAGWLEIILFVTGITFLLLEVFVIPGFGIFGFGGGALVLISVFLATQTFVGWPQNEYQFEQLQHTIWMFGGVAIGAGTLIIVLNHWLPESSIFKGSLILEAQGGIEEEIHRREASDRYTDLIGTEGKVTTQLTPSGKALFGDQLISVITDGILVPKSIIVRVVAVQGNRVFVEPVEPLDDDV